MQIFLLLQFLLRREAPEFGILKSKDGLINSFIEKPKKELLPEWASDTGDEMKAKEEIIWLQWAFIFSTGNLLFDFLQNEFQDATDFGKEIIPQSIKKYKVASYQYNGYWTDIGKFILSLKPILI